MDDAICSPGLAPPARSRRSNLMMINGVWLLRPALDFAVLCQRLQSKLLKHARFRQKVVQDTVPQKIIDRFAQEFEPLLSLTLMLSWAFDDDLRGPSRAFASTPALTR